MTKDGLIVKQQLEIERLHKEESEHQAAVDKVHRILFCIGGPISNLIPVFISGGFAGDSLDVTDTGGRYLASVRPEQSHHQCKLLLTADKQRSGRAAAGIQFSRCISNKPQGS